MTRPRFLCCLLASVLALSTGVAKAEIVTSVTKNSYVAGGADADTALNAGSNLTQLLVKNFDSTGGDFNRKIYLGFDASAFTAASTDFKLNLEFVDSGLGTESGSNSYEFEVYGLNSGGWDESTLTWNNAPQNDTTSGSGFLGGAVSLGTFNRFEKGLGAATFSSGALDTFMGSASGQVTFMIGRNTEAPPQYVHAIAADNATLSAVPEPTSMLLFGTALLGVARRRRK